MPISKYIKPFIKDLIEKGSQFILSKTNPILGNILIGANDISKRYGISDKYTSKAMDIALNTLSNSSKLVPEVLTNLANIGIDMAEQKLTDKLNNELGKLNNYKEAKAFLRPELNPYPGVVGNIGWDPASNNSYSKANAYFDMDNTKEDIQLVKNIPIKKPKVVKQNKKYGESVKDIYYNSKPQKGKIYKAVI